LADALIVLDEVQSIPCILWEPLRQALTGLTELNSTYVLAMSATQPGFLPEALELISNPDPSDFFGRMKRYRLVLRQRNPLKLAEFITECRERLPTWKGQRVLLTLNTRRSARQVFEALGALAKKNQLPVFFITADKTPRDRLAAIHEIKQGNACLVVSTQCVEAGVDIDMHLVIRDFAPLDSLVQIAGRCNRHGDGPEGTVEIVSLIDDHSPRSFAGMIYDPILLQETMRVVEGKATIPEEQLYDLTHLYFDFLREKKNPGDQILKTWLDWQEIPSVRSLFRGKQRPEVSFVVVDQDPELPELLESALDTPDRWDRIRALRRLAPRMARITVSVTLSEKSKLDPADYADPFPVEAPEEDAWFWLLRAGFYDPDRGLDLSLGSEDEPSWGMMI
jgi:CRISPR-associated endonuclease/helicase Cas3